VLAECDARAVSVVKAKWPDAVVWDDVRAVSDEAIRQITSTAPNVKTVFIEAGTPCQDLSGANAAGSGLDGAKSSLLFDIWSLRGRVVKQLSWVHCLTLIENVQSMDSHGPEMRERITDLTGVLPIAACSSGLSDVRRPRYYWIDWKISSGRFAQVEPETRRAKVKFDSPIPDGSRELERGWSRADETGAFATFMRAIPRKRPPFKPCGIDSCDDAAIARWTDDEFRYPPYQYRLTNMVQRGGVVRPLNSRERAIRMGFEADHVEPAVSKRERGIGKKEAEDIKCSLIGNSYHCVVVAWLLGQALQQLDYVEEAPSPEECWGEPSLLGLGSSVASVKSTVESHGYGKYLSELNAEDLGRMVTTHIHRNAMHRGSDVRLATGILMNPSRWPRESVPTKRWRWKVVLAFRQGDDHINALELRAIAASIRWRLRRADGVRSRAVHLTDSQVCQSVMVKGRSSSRRLRHILQRINSLILVSGMVMAYGYVKTDQNPADRPSRWLRKGC